jgi:alpha-ketoglutarate-dependent taurine dioxygenase
VYIVEEVMTPLDREAFSALVALVEHSVTDFLLEAGEIGIIDNYQVAHGRPQYQPRYDGTDRWLKRTQISRDLGAFSHKALVPGRLMP